MCPIHISAQTIPGFVVPTMMCAGDIDTVTLPSFLTLSQVTGYGVSLLDNTTFTITAPQIVTSDSSALYTYRIIYGSTTIDTSVWLVFHPSYYLIEDTAACERFTWAGNTYTFNSTVTKRSHTTYGCDSIERLSVTIFPGYHLIRRAEVTENDLPYVFMGISFNGAVTDTLIPGATIHGCDSNVTFTLIVHPNEDTVVNESICEENLPYLWNGLTLTESCSTTITLTSSHGADSVVTLRLTVIPLRDTTVFTHAVENNLPVDFWGLPRYNSFDTTLSMKSSDGCDSIVHQQLVIHRNHAHTYYREICDGELPYTWDGVTFETSGSNTRTLADSYGADSTVTLTLSVNPTYTVTVDTTICDNQSYLLGDQSLDSSGIYNAVLTTTEGCDSAVKVNIIVNKHNNILLSDILCDNNTYSFGGKEYTQPGVYSYSSTNIYGCDSLVTLQLIAGSGNPKAEICAIPQMVTSKNREFKLHDCSTQSSSRLWLIDGSERSERDLSYTFPDGMDSLPVTMIAFSDEGCRDTARTTIFIDRSSLFVPNAFTPDRETNNTWQPIFNEIEYLEIWLYNRQGLLVAHMEGADARWDGTRDGQPCPQGAYVYNLRYRTKGHPEKTQSMSGTVLLIR